MISISQRPAEADDPCCARPLGRRLVVGAYNRSAIVTLAEMTDIGQPRQLMPPQVPVQQHAVHEQRDLAAALLDVADATRRGLHAVPGRR